MRISARVRTELAYAEFFSVLQGAIKRSMSGRSAREFTELKVSDLASIRQWKNSQCAFRNPRFSLMATPWKRRSS